MAQTSSSRIDTTRVPLIFEVRSEGDGTVLWRCVMPPHVRQIILVATPPNGEFIYTTCDIGDGIIRKHSSGTLPPALRAIEKRKIEKRKTEADVLLEEYRAEVAQ